MTKEQKLYELSKELVYQITGNYTEDTQNGEFQIAWTYLNKAMYFIHCCKSDSEQLKTEKEPLPYAEWKANLNMQKVEDKIYKIGNDYLTINDILEMYEDYCHSF